MTVDVYQTNKQGTYLFLPSGEPFSSVPQPVRDTVGLLQFFNTVELAAEMLGAKHSEIQADLEKQGYAIHKPNSKSRSTSKIFDSSQTGFRLVEKLRLS